MKKLSFFYLFLSFLFFTEIAEGQSIRFVKEGGSGDKSGFSWADASGDLQAMINASSPGDEVWVAGGTYKPRYRADNMNGSNANDRDNAFVLKSNTKIYGGFEGYEISLTQRDSSRLTNTTILSGDLGSVGNISDNAYHVVIFQGGYGTTEMDGFTIEGGNANGIGFINTTSSAVSRMYGGGIYNSSYTSPYSSTIFTNLRVRGNNAYFGGGIYNVSSSPIVTNVNISGNNGEFYCGGMYNSYSEPVLTNVTIGGNNSNYGGPGGGIYNENSSPKIRNCIIYGNSSGIDNDNYNSSPVIEYSLVQGYSAGSNGNINGSLDPKFINPIHFSLSPTTAGNYRIAGNTSPVYNKGNNAYFEADSNPELLFITTDLDGNLRICEGLIDIGAYEFRTPVTWFVKEGASGSGISWNDASGDLQLMISKSRAGDQIWVAAGTYKPRYRADNMNGSNANDRDNAFVLKKDVKILGGFSGNEALSHQRDSLQQINKTILSGDLGTVGDNSDNAYHVIIASGNMGTTELNGLTIKEGNANNSGSITVLSNTIYQYYGGGMVNISSSPILTHVNIIANDALSYGGGIYNENFSSPTLTNVSIKGNNTGSNGGGIYNANSSPILTNVAISGNAAYTGGGIYNSYSSPVLTNLTLNGNNARGDGGGIFNSYSSSILTNVIISGNHANNNGGGICNNYSSPVITNVTISGNNAGLTASGGIYNSSSSPEIRNSIIYGNSSGIRNNSSSVPIIEYSLVQDFSGGTNGNIDGSLDPKFLNPVDFSLSPTTAGDYRITGKSSPVINKGNNTYFIGGTNPDLHLITADLDGNPRIYKGTIDLGAYESMTSVTWFVKPEATGSGYSWNEASGDLQLMINNSSSGDQIWVAAGTYKPLYRNGDVLNGRDTIERSNVFLLKKDVKIYGGFAGNETLLSQRDSSRLTNNTILSGDLRTPGDITDNATHVVISVGDVGMAELNGFTIFGGNARGSGFVTVFGNQLNNSSGAGMYNYSSSPFLSNLTFSGSYAYYGGGLYNTINSSPVLTNVVFSGNSADYGGGIYNSSSSPILTNVIISGNGADFGGGVYNISSSPVLTNVSIAGNRGISDGGGICNVTSSPKIRNSIIYGNTNGIFNNASVPVISYSLVQGLIDESNGNISGNKNPLFEDQLAPGVNTGGNYRLKSGSPAINKGNNDYFSKDSIPDLSAIKTDPDGNNRFNIIIDFGAYENNNSDPLSVTIVNYTAQAEGSSAKLKWTTASESNNKEFIISRSADGKNFIELSKVAGATNFNTEKNYVFYDENPLAGINYYRLEQLDYDGKKTNLGVKMVRFSFAANNSIKIFPNPVKNGVRIEFEPNTYQQVELTDAGGKVLQHLSLSSNDSYRKVDMSNLPSGVYFIKLIGNYKVESRKVVKE